VLREERRDGLDEALDVVAVDGEDQRFAGGEVPVQVPWARRTAAG
jgi:hypothetical protein